VITNEVEEGVTPVNATWEGDDVVYTFRDTSQSLALNEFRCTPRISPYLYAICAGPYEQFTKAESRSGVPLGVFCRRSYVKYLETILDNLFEWTDKGLIFYGDFFGVPYAFSKYDQVFVPEFNAGAMENVGCVTYREGYLPKEAPSKIHLTRTCHVFMHEMAHMWFGNLITMRWWDDLWLNESFAEYISHYAMAMGFDGEFDDIWSYFLGDKSWGYSTDQNKTTHPIFTAIANTEEADSIFDGISYSKGSSVLK
jgi:aminopeptidase N